MDTLRISGGGYMDTLRISERLQGVGMSEVVAKELANIIGHDGDSVATRTDIDRLDTKIDRLDTKIDRKMAFMIAVNTLGFTILGVLGVYIAFIR